MTRPLPINKSIRPGSDYALPGLISFDTMDSNDVRTVHLCRVPDYVLLKQADKRISYLETELGKEKAYAEELESANKHLTSQVNDLKTRNNNLSHQLKTDERVTELRKKLRETENKFHEVSRLYAQLKYKYDTEHGL